MLVFVRMTGSDIATGEARPPEESRSSGLRGVTIPDYALLRAIGSGAYGEVWLARSIMGTYRAVKIIYRQTFDHDRPFSFSFFNHLNMFNLLFTPA